MPTSEEIADSYAFYTEPASEATSSLLGAQHLEWLRSRVPFRTVLDFGCGSAIVGQLFEEAGFDVTGIESDSSIRAQACERLEDVFQSLSDIPPGKSFDLCLLIEVLEHLPDPRATLKEISTRLSPGGSIFVTTPNALGLNATLNRAKWREARNPTHLNLFTSQAVDKIFHQAIGFTPLATEPPLRYDVAPVRRAAHRLVAKLGRPGGISCIYRTAPYLTS